MQRKHSDPLAMMTPHICSAHVLFKALQTPRIGFPVVFKGGQKMQAILMKDAGLAYSSRVTAVLGTREALRLNSAKSNFLLKPTLKWPEESSADRTAMTSVHHKTYALTMPSYGTELQTRCSIQLLAWSSQPASASVQVVLTSCLCCRREQDFQVVARRIIYPYEDFIHNPKS